jgi:hypothetical protein
MYTIYIKMIQKKKTLQQLYINYSFKRRSYSRYVEMIEKEDATAVI